MATKYPIILAHGLFMKPRFFRAFKYLQKRLSEAGYKVYVADTDGVGSIENNVLQLKARILEILKKESAEKINIIAHSKGGLEALYMIEHLGMGDKVASITTISTPYRGSQVAAWVMELPSPILSVSVFICNTFYKILGDKKPDLRAALTLLLPSDEFDQRDHGYLEGIYCQSYSSNMLKAHSDPVLSIPFLISTKREKDLSDGMVSNRSAKFADYKGDCIDGSISHNEIICYMTRRKKKRIVADFYIKLCNELTEKGL